MTTFTQDNNSATFQIRAFKPGTIQVNDEVLTRSIIISADQLIKEWAPQTAQEITTPHLIEALSLQPEILLIGTGSKQIFIPIETYGEFLNQGIGVEIMDTAAAARTYNALTAEKRIVVAALVLT